MRLPACTFLLRVHDDDSHWKCLIYQIFRVNETIFDCTSAQLRLHGGAQAPHKSRQTRRLTRTMPYKRSSSAATAQPGAAASAIGSSSDLSSREALHAAREKVFSTFYNCRKLQELSCATSNENPLLHCTCRPSCTLHSSVTWLCVDARVRSFRVRD